jgi:hypothetical protein
MDRGVTIPALYLNTTISIGKTHFIVLVSHPFPQISHRGGCDSNGSTRSNTKAPKSVTKIFLSIFPEPKNHIQHERVLQEGIPAVWLNPFLIIF